MLDVLRLIIGSMMIRPTREKNMKTIKTLSSGEKATINYNVDAEKKRVVCNLSGKPDGDSPIRFQMNWTFDFSNCSEQQILELATDSIKIKQQSIWRSDREYDNAEKYDNVVFDVATMLNIQRKTKTRDVVGSTKKLFAQMTPEQIKEILVFEKTLRTKK